MLTIVLGTEKTVRDAAIARVIADYKKKHDGEVVFRDALVFGTAALIGHAEQELLFGDKPLLVLTDACADDASAQFLLEHAEILHAGSGQIVCVADSIPKELEKKFTALNITMHVQAKAEKPKPKGDSRVFALTDAFLKKDKKMTWQIFRSLADSGVEAREICNTLFWSMKTLSLVGEAVVKKETAIPGVHPFVFSKTKQLLGYWTPETLTEAIRGLVTLYHEGQFSGKEFDHLLEQYFLEMK